MLKSFVYLNLSDTTLTVCSAMAQTRDQRVAISRLTPGRVTELIYLSFLNFLMKPEFFYFYSKIIFLFYPPSPNIICFVENNNIFLRFCL